MCSYSVTVIQVRCCIAKFVSPGSVICYTFKSCSVVDALLQVKTSYLTKNLFNTTKALFKCKQQYHVGLYCTPFLYVWGNHIEFTKET